MVAEFIKLSCEYTVWYTVWSSFACNVRHRTTNCLKIRKTYKFSSPISFQGEIHRCSYYSLRAHDNIHRFEYRQMHRRFFWQLYRLKLDNREISNRWKFQLSLTHLPGFDAPLFPLEILVNSLWRRLWATAWETALAKCSLLVRLVAGPDENFSWPAAF